MADTACTVVSVVPFELNAEKPTVFPSLYRIPGAKDGDFEILVVEEATATMYVGLDRGNITLPVKSSEIARAIVFDYCSSQLAYGENSSPGLFYVEGRHDKKSILANFAKELHEARQKQTNWFMALIRLADDDWAKHRRHATISTLQRLACTVLKLDREWAFDIKPEDIRLCPGCYTQVHPLAAICASCNTIINEDAFKKLKRA